MPEYVWICLNAWICLDRVLNISWVLNMTGLWTWQGSDNARVHKVYHKIYHKMTEYVGIRRAYNKISLNLQ